MISFKQFISESSETMEEFLASNCMPYLNARHIDPDQFNEDQIYRGMDMKHTAHKLLVINGVKTSCHIVKTHMEREPLDTPYYLHNLMDNLFEQKFGWRPRSQSVFVYGSIGKSIAHTYSDHVYSIFPIGPIKYLWSPEVNDLTRTLRMTIRAIPELKSLSLDRYMSPTDEQFELLLPALQELVNTYRDDQIEIPTGKLSEIMIHCEKYLAVPTSV